jgi:gamma-glutamyltranspeptidase / glutathione hydrolase
MAILLRPSSAARVLAAVLTGTLLTSAAWADPPWGRGEASRSVVWARNGMVAAAQPLAVQIGLDVLKQGGSAVDAAIAVNAALGLMEPTGCGLGGDLFALVWDPKTRKVVGLNASGRAPLALTPEKIPATPEGTIPLHSPFAWTVPGAADGWFELHQRFGKLPMKKILAGAIRYAEEGFPVSPVIAAGWQRSVEKFGDKPGFREVFLPGGRAPKEGELFRNPALARTLKLLAKDGRKAYYDGKIAQAIVRFSQAHGGFFSKEDFARHRSTWDTPISTEYRGHEVWEMPPPGQGLAALQLLNLLETFDLKAMGRDSPDFWHVMVEAKKVVFADRARLYSDPAFASVPVERLLSKEYARERARLIDLKRAMTTDLPAEASALGHGDTTFLVAADSSGMMVSLIQSNYTGFGSGYVVPELGFGLHSRGAQFALAAGHPNRLQPGKRPFHTIIPAMVTRAGQPLMAFGLMGGDMQPQGHAQVLVNLIDFGMNLQQAGDAARFYHTGSSEPTGTVMKGGGILHLEPGLPASVMTELERRGHTVRPHIPDAFGGYQAIWKDPTSGLYAGATERRKDGCALGY